jgi:MFS family permease
MMALTIAFVGETVPKEKTGSAMGLLGTTSAIGTALGPSLGGALISAFGWQAIFLVTVPLGVVPSCSPPGHCQRSAAIRGQIDPVWMSWACCCWPPRSRLMPSP